MWWQVCPSVAMDFDNDASQTSFLYAEEDNGDGHSSGATVLMFQRKEDLIHQLVRISDVSSMYNHLN